MSRHLMNPKEIRRKFGFLRFIVIVLSFISLLSRIIYCTFATWLTVTTFDCIPCPNTSATNATTDLFVAHHSSAVFKTIRSLNVESAAKYRTKRSRDLNDSNQFFENYSQFFKTSDNYDIRPQNENSINKSHQRMNFELSADHKPSDLLSESSEESIERLIPSPSEVDNLLGITSEDRNERPIISEFFGDETSDGVPIVTSNKANAINGTEFERFTLIPSEDLLNVNNISLSGPKVIERTNIWLNSSENNTILIDLNDISSNKSDVNRSQKRLWESPEEVNDTSYLSNDLTRTQMNVCSEDCAQFLNVELTDPDVRKWATIVITGVLYLYAFVMFCIFISTCLALVDLLVLSTFIEGAKLFAGFILIIIDSFNGLSHLFSNQIKLTKH